MIYTVTMNPSLDKYFVVNHLRSDMVNQGTVSEVIAGGKGINVSRFLKVFELNSVILTFTGGFAGQFLVESLRSASFSVVDFPSQGSTRENITLLNSENGEIFKLNEYGPSISSDELRRFMEKVGDLASEGDIWVLAGSLPLGVDEGIYPDLIKILHQKKVRVMLDTSGNALKKAVAAKPEYVHMNSDEVGELVGREVVDHHDLVGVLDGIMQEYSFQAMLCSMGEDGAMLAHESGVFHIAAPVVDVTSTTGAGDAMVSGFLFAMQQGYGMEDMGKWAVAAGSTKASVPGTGLFKRKDVQDKIAEMKVNRII